MEKNRLGTSSSKIRYSWLVLFLGMILVSCILLSGAVSAASSTPVCKNVAEQDHPVIYGNYVVWMDYRNDKGSGNPDIYMKNLKTGKETPVCTAKYEQTSPAIYGNKIVWTDGRNGKNQIGVVNNYDIYMKDLKTGTVTRVTTNKYSQTQPSIYGNMVVYVDNRLDASKGGDGFTGDIYLKNLATGKEIPICTDPSEQYFPKIYGNLVVWEDFRNGGSLAIPDIYMYNLLTHKQTRLVSGGARPSIYGNKVVYESINTKGYNGIKMIDIITKRITTLTSNVQASNPSIYGDLVTWDNLINDLYVKNIKTGKFTHVSNKGRLGNLYSNRIVWVDTRNGNPDIYTTWFDIYPPKIVSTDPVNKAVHVAPDKIIRIKFSETVQKGNMFIELKNSSGHSVKIIKTLSGNMLTIKPVSKLAFGKYTLVLHTGSIKDLAGYSLGVYTTVFTVERTT